MNGKKTSSKVLFLATVYTHLANFHKPFMNLLKKKGYEVHAAASSKEGRKEEIETLGVSCWEIPFERSLFSLGNASAYRSLVNLITTEAYSLIHVHTPIAAFLGRLAARNIKQRKVIYTAHGFHFYKGAPLQNWLIYYPAEKIAAKWTDGLITINEEDFKSALRWGLKPGKKLFKVNGVGADLSFYQSSSSAAIKDQLNIDKSAPVAICCAELSEVKNHLFLLEAWRLVKEWVPNAQLLLVGSGKQEKFLKSKVSTGRITGVHFLGFRKDIPDLLNASDVFVLVSKREGLPKSVMEAMACAKPVVVSDVRGNRDLVEHGRTGVVIKPGNIKQLALALANILQDKETAREMGLAGSKKAEKYSLEKVLTQMDGIYNHFLF